MFSDKDNWCGHLSDQDQKNLVRHAGLVPEDFNPQTLGLTSFDGDCVRDLRLWLKRLSEEIESVLTRAVFGEPGLDVARALLQGLLSGEHVYIEGSSGTGKTSTMELLCEMLDLPHARIDATADASDFSIVGGEMLSKNADGQPAILFRRGPLLTPGALVIIVDELPRLTASASNALLQALAGRRVTVSRTAEKGGSQTIHLSPHLTFLATGNPVNYAGQGERSRALFDRFGIGMLMRHPPDGDRIEMYRSALKSPPRKQLRTVSFSTVEIKGNKYPFSFPLLELARCAVSSTAFVSDDLLTGLLLASYAVSPDAYCKAVGWECEQIAREMGKPEFDLKSYEKLRGLVNESLMEGSNPRGELSAVRNAQWQFLLEPEQNCGMVCSTHMAIGFAQANLARLKPFPGCEDRITEILRRACDLFFPGASVSTDVSEDTRKLFSRLLHFIQGSAPESRWWRPSLTSPRS